MSRLEELETALDIRRPHLDGIEVMPARRLTGPGLVWDRPGAILDIYAATTEPRVLTSLWEKHARRVLDAVGWKDQQLTSRHFAGGVNLAISAPVDQLYSAVLAAEAAWHFCATDFANVEAIPFDSIIGDLKSVIAQERDPALIALMAAAGDHDVDILCDDDEVSLGHGTGSETWSATDLPHPQEVDWSGLHDVPVALITGTNGKTTTTRLCAAIARASGKVAGLTSTDVVQVDDQVLDRGDYSGPQGARILLRDPRVEMAFLEVARGGILRRGLPTRRARVAAVTNIARDHLGEYGIMTLPELAQAKFAVARGLSADGVLVLNADDPHVVTEAANVTAPIWWYSLAPDAPLIRQAQALGRPCAYLHEGDVVFFDGAGETLAVPLDDMKFTLAGAARHNVANALAAIGISIAMGVPAAAVRKGLGSFASGARDNPGRLNEFRYRGARIFVDYAHNPASITAVCEALEGLAAARRLIMLSQPGDRTDHDIAAATTAAMQFRPDLMVVAEIPDYLRGRAPGDTPDLIRIAAIAAGMEPEGITPVASPALGAKMILDQVRPADLVLLLVLSDREQVLGIFDSHDSAP